MRIASASEGLNREAYAREEMAGSYGLLMESEQVEP